jgi:glycerate 2-kinase
MGRAPDRVDQESVHYVPRRTPPRLTRARLRAAAADILASGLRAADPGRLVRAALRIDGRRLIAAGEAHPLGRGRLVLLAAGKAAPAMAAAAEAVLGPRLASGLAVSNAAGPRLDRTRLLLAGHPLPDARGVAASAAVEEIVAGLGREDTLVVLLSGGASALLPAPAPGVSLEDKAAVTAQLLRAGAGITELNTVRKHLSRLKGGGLARAAAPARVAALVLSDVVGDDLSTIASGPTVPDPTTYADARRVLEARGLEDTVPTSVRRHLEAGARGEVAETPKPGDTALRRVKTTVIGSNALSIGAAARQARRHGLRPMVLTTRLEGEAREAARVLVAILRECVATGRPAPLPVCLLAGGETTVTVRGDGRGGRNQELAVAAAALLASFPVEAVVATLATDGIDGASDAAGGVADRTSVDRAKALGLAPPEAFLAASDSHGFLGPLGDLFITGPTGTNVVDLVVLLAADGARVL